MKKYVLIVIYIVLHKDYIKTEVQNRSNFGAKKRKSCLFFDFVDYKMFVVIAIARKLL